MQVEIFHFSLVKIKERNNKGSEQNQLTFTKSSFLAEIEGGPFEAKIFFWSKVTFLGRKHFLTLVSTQNFEF